MGSIVSFPVLCIVNAAICKLAYEIEHNQKKKLRQLPLLINGDDALLRGSDLLFSAWEKMAKFVGMLPSVGKVYFSKQYLNINSTSFLYSSEGFFKRTFSRETGEEYERVCHFELIPYVNMGLLYGYTRSGGASSAASVGDLFSPLGVRAHALVNSSPPNMRVAVYKKYLSRNKKRLQESKVPWFTPAHLGGLGLPILDKFVPTDLDLRVARKIYDNPGVFQVPQVTEESTWLTFKIAKKRLKSFSLSSMSARSSLGLGGHSLQSLVSLLCIEALFTSTKSDLNPVEDFFAPGGGEDQSGEKFFRSKRGLCAAWLLAEKELNEHPNLLAKTALGTKVQFSMAMEHLYTQQLVSLRSLNYRAIADKKIPMPEPFSLDSLPSRPLNTSNLEGAFVFQSELPFTWSSLSG